jgi:hypothetical protein
VIENILNGDGVIDTLNRESFTFYFNNPRLVAETAIRTMAEAGFEHLDLFWRHVALLPEQVSDSNEYIVKPILIDLHRYRRIEEGENIDEIVRKGMKMLNAEMAP